MKIKQFLENYSRLLLQNNRDFDITTTDTTETIIYKMIFKGVLPEELREPEHQSQLTEAINSVIKKIPNDATKPVQVEISFSEATFSKSNASFETEMSAIASFFIESIKAFVSVPESVSSSWASHQETSEMILTVDEMDLGRVSGVQGKFMAALRILLQAIGYRVNHRLLIGSLLDQNGNKFNV